MQNFDGFVVQSNCQQHTDEKNNVKYKTLQITAYFELNRTFDLFSFKSCMITRHSEQVESL